MDPYTTEIQQQPMQPQQSWRKKPILLAGIGVLIVVVLGVGGYFAWKTFIKKPGSSANTNANTNSQFTLPENHDITAEERKAFGIGNEFDAVIKYSQTNSGVVQYIEITNDRRPKDTDGDGMSDEDEKKYKSNPTNPDTDGDELNDSNEIGYKTNPLVKDTDDDSLSDFHEISNLKTDPLKKDTDDDGFDDATEVKGGFNPNGEGKLVPPTPSE